MRMIAINGAAFLTVGMFAQFAIQAGFSMGMRFTKAEVTVTTISMRVVYGDSAFTITLELDRIVVSGVVDVDNRGAVTFNNDLLIC